MKTTKIDNVRIERSHVSANLLVVMHRPHLRRALISFVRMWAARNLSRQRWTQPGPLASSSATLGDGFSVPHPPHGVLPFLLPRIMRLEGGRSVPAQLVNLPLVFFGSPPAPTETAERGVVGAVGVAEAAEAAEAAARDEPEVPNPAAEVPDTGAAFSSFAGRAEGRGVASAVGPSPGPVFLPPFSPSFSSPLSPPALFATPPSPASATAWSGPTPMRTRFTFFNAMTLPSGPSGKTCHRSVSGLAPWSPWLWVTVHVSPFRSARLVPTTRTRLPFSSRAARGARQSPTSSAETVASTEAAGGGVGMLCRAGEREAGEWGGVAEGMVSGCEGW